MVAQSKHVCYICKRKFNGAPLLSRHEKTSKLHQDNLARQDRLNVIRKEELRHAIHAAKRQIEAVEERLSQADGLGTDEQLQEMRMVLGMQMRQMTGEYSSAQEKVEKCYPGGQDVPGECEEIRIGSLLLSAGASAWQGNKDSQEDRYQFGFKVSPPGGAADIACYMVCDGHAGQLCVDAVLATLPANIQKCLSTKTAMSEECLRQSLNEACCLTDDDFLQKARALEVLDGCTLILACFWNDVVKGKGENKERVMVCNIGDSRAVLGRADSRDGRPKALRLSDDHKPERMDERRRIENHGGVVDLQGVWRVFTPGMATFGGRELRWGLAVSRSFGDILLKRPQRYGCAASGELVSATPEITVYDLNLHEDRFIVLACDGVWDVLEDRDAVSACIDGSPSSPGQAAHNLVKRAYELGSDDNITALLIAWRTAVETPEPTPDGGGTGEDDDQEPKRARKE